MSHFSQAQMELRDRRVWDLRDLLGIAGEPPTSAGDGNSSLQDTWYMRPQQPMHPRLVGPSHEFCTATGAGLPSFLTQDEQRSIRRCIAVATRGANPVLSWKPPVMSGAQLKMTLVNLQELPLSPSRYRLVTLRAKRSSSASILTADHVKVMVEMDAGERAYFAGCLCFFADASGGHYVALRWLTEIPGVVLDPASGLVPLALSPVDSTSSYSVLPVSAIANGACLSSVESKIYASLSPREERAYIASNFSNAS